MSTVSRRGFIKMLGMGAVMVAMPSMLTSAIGQAAGTTSLRARVRVRSGADPERALNRRLFGKFSEHLGKNVYGGAWAQILPNPDFVPITMWPDKNPVVNQLRTFAKSHNLPIMDVTAAMDLQPPWWAKRGSIELETGEVDGRPTVILAPAAAGGGRFVTTIYLPAHRTRTYVAKVRVRGTVPLKVSLRHALTGEELAAATIAAGQWAANEISLELGTAISKGTPCDFALEPVGAGMVEIRQCLLFPADHLDGWDPDVVRYMREARLSLLRFPGGNFVSGYHWEDGVGPLEQRPVKPNPAWPIVEWNHVGTDEWLRLCELVGCEPLICVNAGNGTAEEAACWVEYCNGSVETPMGARRAQNGHPAPYNVRLWEVGNELYGGWQVGNTDSFSYGLRYKRFAEHMQVADPNIILIANGYTADWNRTAMYTSGGTIRSFSHHALMSNWPTNADPERVYLEHMAHTPAYAQQWEELTKPLKDRDRAPHLAITEMQVFTKDSRLPTNATLTEALWTASIINEAIRSDGLVEFITHSALINHGGGLRKDQEQVWAQPVWWTTHLYGTIPDDLYRLDLDVESPSFSVQPYKMRVVEKAPYLDAVGLGDRNGSTLVFFLVNRHPKQAVSVELELPDMTGRQVEKATLTGPSFLATNTRANPEAVKPVYEYSSGVGGEEGQLVLPPLSLVRLIIS